MALFTYPDGLSFLLRWIHFLAGITWIGLLYYFNFVQIPYFAETKTGAGTGEFRKLVYRALAWFRWGAMATLLSGLGMMGVKIAVGGGAVMAQSWGVAISAGALFGILMFLNVWLVIWPNQKVVLASLDAVAEGGQADPRSGPAGARAFLASRTNTLFSIPMLFFMGAASHLPLLHEGGKGGPALGVITLLALFFEGVALFGKKALGPAKMLEKPVAVIHIGLVLALVCYGAIAILA